MCGVVGYIGKRGCKELIIEGLQRLEYRGYDSAGVTVAQGNELSTIKSEGKLAKLKPLMTNLPDSATRGVGHTRWATHGVPSTRNAHPHATNDFALVHNGIIENYDSLRQDLIKGGVTFASETDSEVVLHLLERESRSARSPLDAIIATIQKLKGAFALGVIVANDPEHIYVVKEGSPLVLGVGDGENFFASDALAIGMHTQKAIFLADGQLARVSAKKVEIFDFEGRPQPANVRQLSFDASATEKHGFKHYMLKEIHEQPRVIRTLASRLMNVHTAEFADKELGISGIDLKRVEHIVLTGCGTAFYSGLLGKYFYDTNLRVPVEVELASELRYRNSFMSDKTLFIAVSQSGETADTLAAVKMAREKKAQVLALCNVELSSIVRESHGFLHLQCGPEIGVASTKAFTAMVLAHQVLAVAIGSKKGSADPKAAQDLASGLGDLSAMMDIVLDTAGHVEALAKMFYQVSDFLFIGRGYNYPLALEGALKLKEISYIHAEGYAGGELKHGPIALVDKNMVILAIAPPDALYEKMLSNIEEVRSREGRIIGLGAPGDDRLKRLCEEYLPCPQLKHSGLQTILSTIPLQLLAYYVAICRGTDVDQPRNLAKSVTVE